VIARVLSLLPRVVRDEDPKVPQHVLDAALELDRFHRSEIAALKAEIRRLRNQLRRAQP
jgi:HAMP domain-containing protein